MKTDTIQKMAYGILQRQLKAMKMTYKRKITDIISDT